MVPIPPPTSVSATATAQDLTSTANAPEDADTSMADAAPEPTSQEAPAPTSSETSKKRKRKDKETPHILYQSTFRKPRWSYFHLCLITPRTASHLPLSNPSSDPPSPPTQNTDISPVIALPLLTQPLTSYLGTTGAAIPIDVLATRDRAVWIRIPRQDARALRASLSGWVGNCDAGNMPGLGGNEDGSSWTARVKVAWRVVGEAGLLGLLGEGGDRGDGGEMFGG